ncbi:hypothetical protein PPYR_12821 [Photinus pyralis]|uniref:poly(ADP-ribose) glycohydrolase n=1 Tax=Photinus pyralis TaxID=7054 RepID=A0A1Y1KZH8_PHOPY|nr:poly(ADP-ribose) glycohydrolase [Photinus pyralis]XP_031353990.1 poly(ADP-ribose) glycohydrolase [Photinus pyralis]KAB0793201.1 hypothetical protein PPYR_12821 [Photinus pyralis]
MAGSTKYLGTSMEAMYGSQGPWNYELPPIIASRYHSVLYQLPASLKSPPKPHISTQNHHWDSDHVHMPYSPKNLQTVKNSNGSETPKLRWEIIQEALLQPISSSKQLEMVLNKYNTRLPKLSALHYFFEEVLENEESEEFFESLLPGIIRLALQLPEILPGNLPLLKKGSCKSISLSQLQIASLLANGFLCTFPWREEVALTYPGINFSGLFSSHFRSDFNEVVAEKLKCICHYFRRVLTVEPVGIVTFERKFFPRSHLPRWDRLENNLGNIRIHISSNGFIEDDGDGLLQVDFANKSIGGGVLGYGCVQEEIRFMVCPELIVSRLFTEHLGATEALIIIGAERYSKYTGYGDTFVWAGNYNDNTPYDHFGRRRTSIVAIDALFFGNPLEQYNPSSILREVNKAYVGFHSRLDSQLSAVATGNWGCGAFRGDPNLKLLIQLMASNAARRDIVYFTFGDVELRNNIYEMYQFLATNDVTIAQLWRYLCRFEQSNLKPKHLFSYIQQAHFDSKNQRSLKDYFCFRKKPDLSTSNANYVSSKSPSTSAKAEDVRLDPGETDNIVIASSQTDSDTDIIESSQPDDLNTKLPRFVKSPPAQATKDNVSQDAVDVIRLIDEIDGKETSTHRADVDRKESMSLLTTLDKLTRSEPKSRDVEVKQSKEEEVEKMEVDHEPVAINKSKRKITDYFATIDKG